jgi:hypothetical protein
MRWPDLGPRRRVVLALALIAVGLLFSIGIWAFWPPHIPSPMLRATLDEGDASSPSFIAFSPDGRTLATGDTGNGRVTLWNVGTNEKTAALEGHPGEGTDGAFSPDGLTRIFHRRCAS